MKKKKTELNLINLKKELKSKDWDKMSKEEKHKFCQELADKMFPKK